MELVEAAIKAPKMAYLLLGALLGWVVVVGPFVPKRTPWTAGLTNAVPTTTLVALAEALKWDRAAVWLSTAFAPWIATQLWIFVATAFGLFFVLMFISGSAEHVGFMPSATFWICVAGLAQTWESAGGGARNFVWLLLLSFLILSVGIPAVRRKRAAHTLAGTFAGERFAETMVYGLTYPLYLARPLVSGKDDS